MPFLYKHSNVDFHFGLDFDFAVLARGGADLDCDILSEASFDFNAEPRRLGSDAVGLHVEPPSRVKSFTMFFAVIGSLPVSSIASLLSRSLMRLVRGDS